MNKKQKARKMQDVKQNLIELIAETMNKKQKARKMQDVKQNLIELIADYLDSETHRNSELFGGLYDPVDRGNTELHIRMANAAFNEYINTINPIAK